MSQSGFNKADVIGREPKHITYVKAQDGSNHDALVAKEIIHLKDGRKVPYVHVWEDYERPFWLTHKGRRTHQEKRSHELVKHLQKYKCKQINLSSTIARVLGDFSMGPNPPLRRLARSPYLYGADVSSSCLLKADYRERWPELLSPNRVAAGDIETNVHSRDEEIIMMSVTCGKQATLLYLERWLDGIENPIEQTHAMAKQYIGEVMEKRDIELEVVLCPTPGQIVIEAAKRLHAWKPDFFTFWNMDFDVSRMLTALEREGINPAEVFSDPKVPEQYRYFDYRRGPSQKVTASGKTMSINIEDRWNWVTHPASFQFIDSLPVYRILRIASGKDSSYALDYILQKELKLTKLKFDQVSHLSGLRWHEVMQEQYKIEYGIYNVFDSISLELLDEKTNDLSRNITLFSKNSDYKNFNSNPKRLCDDMHFWYLNRPEPAVIGTSSDDPISELDQDVIGHSDWIVTLPSYMAANNGIRCIKDYPNYASLIYSHVVDLDVVSAYPNISQLLNIAPETCLMEFSRMQGITEHHRREVGVNLTGGRTNATEICEKILQAPTLDQLLNAFKQHKGIPIEPTPENYVELSATKRVRAETEVVRDETILED